MALMITKMLVAIALAVLIARPSFAQQNFLSGQTPPGVDRRLPLGAVGNSLWRGAGAFPSPRRGVLAHAGVGSEDAGAISLSCGRTHAATRLSTLMVSMARGRLYCRTPTTRLAGRFSGVPTCFSTRPIRVSTISTLSTYRAGPTTR